MNSLSIRCVWKGLSVLEMLQKYWLIEFNFRESSASKIDFKLDMVAHASNPSTWGAGGN